MRKIMSSSAKLTSFDFPNSFLLQDVNALIYNTNDEDANRTVAELASLLPAAERFRGENSDKVIPKGHDFTLRKCV